MHEYYSVYTNGAHNLLSEKIPLKIFRRIHDKYNIVDLHRHEFIEIVVVKSGSSSHIIQLSDGSEYIYKIKAGDIFVINPGELHKFSSDEDEVIEIINILFDPTLLNSSLFIKSEDINLMDFIYTNPLLPPNIRFNNTINLNKQELDNVLRNISYIEDEFAKKRIGYELFAGMHLMLVLAQASRHFAEQNDGKYIEMGYEKTNITRVIGYLERHYSEHITIESLTSVAFCSERQITKKFKEITGETVIEYLHRLRINRACSLLISTNLKITEVATKVGFSDISFFNRIFLRKTGLTPTEYRKNNKVI